MLNTGLDAVKTASKKVVHKAGEFLRNKIADAVNKLNERLQNYENAWKSKKDLRNNCSTKKKRQNIKQIEKSIIKMEHFKISKLLNDSTVCFKICDKEMELKNLIYQAVSILLTKI